MESEPAGPDVWVWDGAAADDSVRVADAEPAVAGVDALVAAVGTVVVRPGVVGATGVLVGTTGFLVGSPGVLVGPTGFWVDSFGVAVGSIGVLVSVGSVERDDVTEGRGVGSEPPFPPQDESSATHATATRQPATRPDTDLNIGAPPAEAGQRLWRWVADGNDRRKRPLAPHPK